MSEKGKIISDRLVWADVETTGTDDHDTMLEIAVIVTDNDLNELGVFSSLIIDCDPRNLIPDDRPRAKESDVPCWSQHFESGLVMELIKELCSDDPDPTINLVEDRIINFLNGHGVYENMEMPPPLCGSSIHFDRRFLRKEMSKMIGLLHYRNIDVSCIRECARRWSPQLEIPKLDAAHRTVDDLRNSIELGRLFRDKIFSRS